VSFSIPAIQTTDLTAAAIATQVWATKETISAWTLHDIETDLHAPPTQNVYHEVFDLETGQILHWIAIKQENGEVAAKNVDIKLTIDGEVYEKIGNALDHAEFYYVYFNTVGDDLTAGIVVAITNASPLTSFGIAIEDSDGIKTPRASLPMIEVKLEVRQTSALGTNQTLNTYYRRSSLEAV